MKRFGKWAILTLGLGCVFTAAAMAQGRGQSPRAGSTPRPALSPPAASSNLIVISGALDWWERADVSAQQEGTLEYVEYHVGDRLNKGDEIGRLNDDIARLNAEKSKLIADGLGGIGKAIAQQEQAASKLARLKRLEDRQRGLVPPEELDAARADLNFADALKLEAEEKQKVDRKEAELAAKLLEQHKIISPLTGVVIERMKNPGESVRANEAVVRLGQTDKYRFVGWVSFEQSQRLRRGDPVQFRVIVDGAKLAIEDKVFEGKLVAIGPELELGDSEVRVLAEINNPSDPDHPELELYQGMKGEITIAARGATTAGDQLGAAVGQPPR